MMVASHRLFSRGYTVTTYQDALHQLASWFPDHQFKKRSLLKAEQLASYDLIVLQNDNSPLANSIIDLYKQGKLPNLSVFYSSYEKEKHASLTSWDRIFDRSRPMVTNIAAAIASLLQCTQISKNNGLIIPSGLKQSRHPKRVIMHPTSTTPTRTWNSKKFIQVANSLSSKGYEITFSVSPDEHPTWIPLVESRFHLPLFPSLSELAAYLYESAFLIGNESGTGHLASNLHIPTLIIASCPKQMALWRPGWFMGKVITPYRYIPNFKGSRWRKKNWQTFISPRRVIHTFQFMQMRQRFK
ncbi:MAG: glycosyltransferase family 9 protein [Desulfobacterium sp.]